TFRDALRMGADAFHALKSVLQGKGLSTAVGDAGGFAPNLRSNEAALDVIVEPIEKAGFKPGEDIALALAVASSELSENGLYRCPGEGKTRNADEMIEFYTRLIEQYPIVSIEDPLDEEAWADWA